MSITECPPFQTDHGTTTVAYRNIACTLESLGVYVKWNEKQEEGYGWIL